MNNKINSEKGITLVALVITIIVLIILAGIGIGELSGNRGSIDQTKNTMILAELDKVQQVVIENYIKFKQLGNETVLFGSKLSSADYTEANNKLKALNGNKGLLMGFDENEITEKCYYKINKTDLEKMGLENIHNNDEYVVNYSTGEVFNITQEKTVNNEILYIYARDNT